MVDDFLIPRYHVYNGSSAQTLFSRNLKYDAFVEYSTSGVEWQKKLFGRN